MNAPNYKLQMADAAAKRQGQKRCAIKHERVLEVVASLVPLIA